MLVYQRVFIFQYISCVIFSMSISQSIPNRRWEHHTQLVDRGRRPRPRPQWPWCPKRGEGRAYFDGKRLGYHMENMVVYDIWYDIICVYIYVCISDMIWYVIHDLWYMIFNMWYLICDIWDVFIWYICMRVWFNIWSKYYIYMWYIHIWDYIYVCVIWYVIYDIWCVYIYMCVCLIQWL
jgi:hypothetical protein